eukprot:TRINITY_DN88078_c0_g1_i1.p1 TRINITY_DN88078_c0_g1~~TRINITY_DN88078_c0_g1_i1.p1  ORF type:complete len:346 (-),score=51.17 TRINITY_DN88078_c0_g1_i1:38-1075(-)
MFTELRTMVLKMVLPMLLWSWRVASSNETLPLAYDDAECMTGQCALGLLQLRGQKHVQRHELLTPCAKIYDQCGGYTNKGPTCCQAGLLCREKDAAYSQCLPGQSGKNSHRSRLHHSDHNQGSHSRNHSKDSSVRKQDGGHPSGTTLCPMKPYNGPTSGAASCFCHKAGNPTCIRKQCSCREGCRQANVHQSSETSTFVNRNAKVSRCQKKVSMLTIPRSYFKDIGDMLKVCRGGTERLLTVMLIKGAEEYARETGSGGSVMQCIHKSEHVSVNWLHLHTFCPAGHVDGMPNKRLAFCQLMHHEGDAARVASLLVKQLVTERLVNAYGEYELHMHRGGNRTTSSK